MKVMVLLVCENDSCIQTQGGPNDGYNVVNDQVRSELRDIALELRDIALDFGWNMITIGTDEHMFCSLNCANKWTKGQI